MSGNAFLFVCKLTRNDPTALEIWIRLTFHQIKHKLKRQIVNITQDLFLTEFIYDYEDVNLY